MLGRSYNSYKASPHRLKQHCAVKGLNIQKQCTFTTRDFFLTVEKNSAQILSLQTELTNITRTIQILDTLLMSRILFWVFIAAIELFFLNFPLIEHIK